MIHYISWLEEKQQEMIINKSISNYFNNIHHLSDKVTTIQENTITSKLLRNFPHK
jgi:hypothetical protein